MIFPLWLRLVAVSVTLAAGIWAGVVAVPSVETAPNVTHGRGLAPGGVSTVSSVPVSSVRVSSAPVRARRGSEWPSVVSPVGRHAVGGGVSALDRPNVIVINVDDLDTFLLDHGRVAGVFPNLQRLASEGVQFTNCHVTSPLCGPSRASLLTGRYVFEHGLRVHDPAQTISNGFAGGYRHYMATRSAVQPSMTKPDWRQFEFSRLVQPLGYRTMLVGKYLHADFSPFVNQTWSDLRPPGWDDFYTTLGGLYYDAPRYLSRRRGVHQETVARISDLSLDAYPERYRPLLQSRYRTNIEFVDSIQLIDQHLQRQPEQPFLLYLAPYAPHTQWAGAMLDGRYESWWPNMRQPWRPDFNLANVSGKPPAIAHQPLLDAPRLAQANAEYRQRMLAMKSCDDMLGVLRQYLDETGLAAETLIFFTSDNGYHLGQQRHFGKQLPYDSSTRVPLIVWGPGMGVASGQVRSHLISHVDILPTILDVCQANPVVSDGVSIRSLWSADEVPHAASWRPEGVLSEHYQKLGSSSNDSEGVYHSIRLYDQRYTRWADGATEYYDLLADPFERLNRAGELSSGERALFERLLTGLRPEEFRFGGSIARPLYDNQVFFRRVELEGYAEAIEGVAEVRLVIRRRKPGPNAGSWQFYNGQQWQDDFRQVRASLAAPNASLTRWTYDFFPTTATEERVQVTARVYDRAGQFQTHVLQRSFLLDGAGPVTAITQPIAAQTVVSRRHSYSISGWASGDAAIREVRVVVRDLDSGEYFDGQQWRSGFGFLPAELTFPNDSNYANWSYQLPPGDRNRRLVVSARASQTDGRFDATVAVTRLEWQ